MLRLIENLGIGVKLALAAGLMLVTSIGLLVAALAGLADVSSTAQTFATVRTPRLVTALQAARTITQAGTEEKNAIIEKTAEAVRRRRALFDAVMVETEAQLTSLHGLARTERKALVEEARRETQAYRTAIGQAFTLLDQGRDAEAAAISVGEGRRARRRVVEILEGIVAANQAELAALTQASAESEAVLMRNLIIGAVAGLGLAGLMLGWIARFQIAKPLGEMTAKMRQLAGGDLEIRVEGKDRRDEVGQLAQALDVFRQNAVEARRAAVAQAAEQAAKERRGVQLAALIGGFEGSVGGLTGHLASAATELEATARSMSRIAEQTTAQAGAVSTAAASTGSGVQTVAAATEELSSSISEISRQVAQATTVMGRAVQGARETDGTVRALATSAGRIGEVVNLISGIAGQTNLLALNATIEAARAGEAGKGFAVVASEVKTLAAQTAKATEEIASQINGIQGVTEDAVRAIEAIAATISEVSEITSSIAAAVTEQSAATAEIARTVQTTAQATEQVTRNIGQVGHNAGETGAASAQVLTAAGELAQSSTRLSSEVGNFLAQVRAA